mmetsp:Transcript_36978/g.86662  ORF Transcript_36978/g.86662 Transcript_36978/m.86662 type:complete len:245 (+) Transcript_36978:823-1557(+)
MILDMSLKYRLSSNKEFSGAMLSTIVVKDAMSENSMLTSTSLTSMQASSLALIITCTTGQGTYLPHDLIAFFILSKVLRISRNSFAVRSSPSPSPSSSSSTTSEFAISKRAIDSMSSVTSLRGFSKFEDKEARSFVKRPMLTTMITTTELVMAMLVQAICRTSSLLSTTARDVVSASSSAKVLSLSKMSGISKADKSATRKSWRDVSSTLLKTSLTEDLDSHRGYALDATVRVHDQAGDVKSSQ